MRSGHSNPYSAARIVTGIRHFLMGKALTSVAGIGTLFLVIRGLPIPEFAAYSVLLGLIDVLAAAASMGTGQVLTRFVPEIFNRHYTHALRLMLGYAFGLRFALLAVTILIIAGIVPVFAKLIGLQEWQVALQLYLLVVFLRTATNSLYQALEAMLHQGRGQTAFAAVTVLRFLGVAGLSVTGHLNLVNLILVEIGTDGIGTILMGSNLFQVSRARPEDSRDRAGEMQWLRSNARRIINFGIKGHLQGLIIMPFSGMVNRLVIGSQLPAAQVALFGFGQSIFDLMQRYLPAQLFSGLVRPVMAARFSATAEFGEAQTISNAVLTINLVVIGLATTTIVAGGTEMLLWISGGKYGDRAVGLLLLMCLLIALESWRHVLDQLCHTVERYGFLIFSNGLLGMSLLGGLALLPAWEIFALPAANCAGLVVANLLVIGWLRRTGFPYKPSLLQVGSVIFATGLGISAGLLLTLAIDGWLLRVLAAAGTYCAMAWALVRPKPEETRLFRSIAAGSRSA